MSGPKLLTDAVGEAIRSARATGMPMRRCAAAAGVKWTTVIEWLRRGREGVEPYATWVRQWDEASGEMERELRASVLAGARDNADVALKYLAFLDGHHRRVAETQKARHEARLAKLRADGAAPLTEGPELALPASLTVARLDAPDAPEDTQ